MVAASWTPLDGFLKISAWIASTLTAAVLAFIGTRLADRRKAVHEDSRDLMVELRSAVRETVDVSVSYWTKEIRSSDRAAYEAKIRVLEADLRELLNEVGRRLSSTDAKLVVDQAINLIAELSAGDFEGVARVKTLRQSDIDRARRIAAMGAKLRSTASRVWRNQIRSRSIFQL
jgi:hypothetical protein